MNEALEEVSERDTEGDRPVGLPENFRDIDALLESYHQAVGRVSQLTETSRELESTLDAVLQAQESEPEIGRAHV